MRIKTEIETDSGFSEIEIDFSYEPEEEGCTSGSFDMASEPIAENIIIDAVIFISGDGDQDEIDEMPDAAFIRLVQMEKERGL